MKRLRFLLPWVLLLCVVPVLAQDAGSCPALVELVRANLNDACSATDRNQACYVNSALETLPRPSVAEFQFNAVGDIENVTSIESLRLSPMNDTATEWGVALMQLQTSLPDVLAGQNVLFLAFGDVEMVTVVPENHPRGRPMQAFYFRTSFNDVDCVEAPESGLLIRTPEGVGEVSFSLNGIDVGTGSIVFLQTYENGLNIRTYTGSTSVTIGGSRFPIIAGTQLSIPLGEDLLPTGDPVILAPLPQEPTSLEPYRMLGDEVTIAAPLTIDEIGILVNDYILPGVPPCGEVSFLPSCDALIGTLGGNNCRLLDDGVTRDCAAPPNFVWADAFAPIFTDVTRSNPPVLPTAGPSATPGSGGPGVPTATPPEDSGILPTNVPPGVPTNTPQQPGVPTNTPQQPGVPTNTPQIAVPTNTPQPGVPTSTPQPGVPTSTPQPGVPTNTPQIAVPTSTPVQDVATPTRGFTLPISTPPGGAPPSSPVSPSTDLAPGTSVPSGPGTNNQPTPAGEGPSAPTVDFGGGDTNPTEGPPSGPTSPPAGDGGATVQPIPPQPTAGSAGDGAPALPTPGG